MPVSPAEIIQLVSYGGATGVLLLVVYLFLRGSIVTAASAKEREDVITTHYGARLADVQRQRDELWTLAQRTQGSQLVQATAAEQAAQAIAAAVQKLIAPQTGMP